MVLVSSASPFVICRSALCPLWVLAGRLHPHQRDTWSNLSWRIFFSAVGLNVPKEGFHLQIFLNWDITASIHVYIKKAPNFTWIMSYIKETEETLLSRSLKHTVLHENPWKSDSGSRAMTCLALICPAVTYWSVLAQYHCWWMFSVAHAATVV